LAIQRFYESGGSVALILEDDATGAPSGVRDRIDHLLDVAPPEWDILKLASVPRLSWKGPLVRRMYVSGDASVYLIHRRGAKKILRHRIMWPFYPDMLVNFACKVFTVTASYPTLAQTWDSTTTIHGNRYGPSSIGVSAALNTSALRLGPTNIVLLTGDVLLLLVAAVVVSRIRR
jgi:hypothetical protein